jgi:hypothetical protein
MFYFGLYVLFMVFKKYILEPGVMVHTHNPRTGRLSQEDGESEASLDYTARSCLEKQKI